MRDTGSKRVGSYAYYSYNAKLDVARRPQLTTQMRLVDDGQPAYEGKATPYDVGDEPDSKRLFPGGLFSDCLVGISGGLMAYKAFISYSHAADGQLAPALQSGLLRIAKPFYRLRVIRIFRDETSLHLTPKLWPTIQQALNESEHFILMASPAAAASKWVQDEVNERLRVQDKALEKVHIVLTEGEIVWDNSANDFDWGKTTALPENLRGRFTTEPLYLDFRWARKSEHLSLRNPQFLKAVGRLAAAIHDKPLDDIIGEDVRQHRVFKLAAGVTMVLLSALLVAASAAAYYANERRKEAKRQSEIALARQLAAQSELIRSQRAQALPLAVSLGVESMRRFSSPEIDQVLWRGLILLPRLVTQVSHAGGVAQVAFSPKGEYLATASEDKTAYVIRLRDNLEIAKVTHGECISLPERMMGQYTCGKGTRGKS